MLGTLTRNRMHTNKYFRICRYFYSPPASTLVILVFDPAQQFHSSVIVFSLFTGRFLGNGCWVIGKLVGSVQEEGKA